MKRVEPRSVGDILTDFFEQRKLRSAVIEGRAVEVWADVVGAYAASFTEDVYIRSGVLYVTISNASVRSEIYVRRRYLISRVNEVIGTRAVRNLVVR